MSLPELEQLLARVLAPRVLPPPALPRLAIILNALLEAQGRLNLTSIREPEAIAVAHFADSLAGLDAEPLLSEARRGADIGPGGGFPILPLASVLPGCSWTGIESVAKKCRFIEETAGAAGLSNVRMECERAEEACRSALRGQLDAVTARAVGPVASLLEVGLPLLRSGGRLLLYKTESTLDEWEQSSGVLEKLGGRALPAYRYRFPDDRQGRVILRAECVSLSPEQYPRGVGLPFNKPLA